MRTNTTLVVATVAALTGALAAPAAAERLDVADHGGRPLSATLTGAQEVPGPGDPDGTGTALVTINPGQGIVCWEITVADITLPARAAHIHRGPAGVAGPVEVTLSAPGADGTASGCAEVARELIDEIRKAPAEFYVNVHTSDFPPGAVRGQLGWPS